MKPSLAPGTTWEVRLRWGSRRLTAELLGLERRTLSLGNTKGDDFDTGSAARLRFTLGDDGALMLRFSTGVTGTVSLGGDRPSALGQLTQRGLASEASGEGDEATYTVSLREGDVASLRVGSLTVDVRRARGRLQRLPFDLRALVLVVLALGAIGLIIASVSAPQRGPNPTWISPKRR
jgi:hypothetical protein